MVRLYTEASLELGKWIELDERELAYLKVRRRQDDMELFNRHGFRAKGRLEKKKFLVEAVEEARFPLLPVTIAVGLPEVAVQEQLIFSLSEFGVRELIFFPAGRSQSPQSRLPKLSARWERLRIEAARQCERGALLGISTSTFEKVISQKGAFFLDEDPEAAPGGLCPSSPCQNDAFVIIGPEGGWTPAERDAARDRQLTFVHWEVPILRVSTAAIAAAMWCYQKINCDKAGRPIDPRISTPLE